MFPASVKTATEAADLLAAVWAPASRGELPGLAGAQGRPVELGNRTTAHHPDWPEQVTVRDLSPFDLPPGLLLAHPARDLVVRYGDGERVSPLRPNWYGTYEWSEIPRVDGLGWPPERARTIAAEPFQARSRLYLPVDGGVGGRTPLGVASAAWNVLTARAAADAIDEWLPDAPARSVAPAQAEASAYREWADGIEAGIERLAKPMLAYLRESPAKPQGQPQTPVRPMRVRQTS